MIIAACEIFYVMQIWLVVKLVFDRNLNFSLPDLY